MHDKTIEGIVTTWHRTSKCTHIVSYNTQKTAGDASPASAVEKVQRLQQ
jgi:hypothetical protein